ncbi:MFS transporter [Actinokineospora globicatena]|uniref:MFS transporter n=1 Tax=Actinokineospora globicatena TaxID=103729 RepID=UPI002554D76D|nr:MFS transporter [Actinokineospora globicatena]
MTSSAVGAPERAPKRRVGLTLALLAFAQLIISIDYNIVYVALPQIGTELGFSQQTLQWVISAYAVAFGGFLLLGGRACDLFGPRRMFVLGLALYGASSLLGGLAPNPQLLIAARALQGVGGAFLFPATLTLVSTSFAEGPERNRAFSVWGAAGGSGMILGSLLGGVLAQSFGWEAVFFVNVPLAALALGLAFVLIAPDVVAAAKRKFDLLGALTSTIGTTAVVVALVQGPESGWLSPVVVISAVVGIVLLISFLLIEKNSSDPLMPLRLFGNRNLGTGMAVTFLYMATMGTLLYFLTVYFQGVRGYNALETGLAYLVPMVAIFTGAMVGGNLATRFGMRAVMVGSLVVGAVGTLITALSISPDGTYLALVPGMLILGLGQGTGYTLMFGAATSGIDPAEQGVGSGMASTSQQVGGALGLAILVAIANSVTDGATGESPAAATVSGLTTAMLVAAAGIVVTVFVALNFARPKPSAPVAREELEVAAAV